MTRPDPQDVLHRATLDAGPLLAYLGADAAAGRLGWPRSAVQAAQAHPKLRRRLAHALARRLSLAPHELRRAAELLPRDEEALATACLMFGLTAALAAHAGVFRRAEYAKLRDDFGPTVLDFAMRQRTLVPTEARLPRITTEREAVEGFGRVEFSRALQAAGHPLARILQTAQPGPEPAEADGEGANGDAAEGAGDAAPVRVRTPGQVGRPALLIDLAEAALAGARTLEPSDGPDPAQAGGAAP